MKTLEEQLASALDAADLHGIITLETLSSLIAAQNLDMPAGYVYDENGNGIIVTVGDAIADGEDLENLVLLDLGIEGLDPIRVCDVADVVRADNAGGDLCLAQRQQRSHPHVLQAVKLRDGEGV